MDKKGLELESVIFNETQQESWPERDALPTQDPIGDVDDPMESHRLDAMRYMSTMKGRVIEPEGKNFDVYKDADSAWGVFPDNKNFDLGFEFIPKEAPTCNCGTFAVHGNVPASGHAPYCALRKNKSI